MNQPPNPEWDGKLPFQPDYGGVTREEFLAAVLGSVGRSVGEKDLSQQWTTANKVVESLAWLIGAQGSGFVEVMDAGLRDEGYYLRVYLSQGQDAGPGFIETAQS